MEGRLTKMIALRKEGISFQNIGKEIHMDAKEVRLALRGYDMCGPDPFSTLGDVMKPKNKSVCKDRRQYNGGAKLTLKEAEAVYDLSVDSDLTQREIGEMFGITGSQVCKIKTGKSWII